MLKIKDNVDLKELKKYGFKYCDISKYDEFLENKFMSYLFKGQTYIDEDRKFSSCVWPEEVDTYANEDMLYDLIKADLVEKVDD